MAGVLEGRDLELFCELKRRGVLRPVLKEALEPRDGVLGFGCGDDRNGRMRDLCVFHVGLQDGVREEPKSFLFGWPGGPLGLTPISPLKGAIIAESFCDTAFFTIKKMIKAANYNSFLLHAHYPCLAVEKAIGLGALFQAVNVLFEAKRHSKAMLPGITVAALCQFDLGGEDDKKSYYLDRECWNMAYPELLPYYK
ncbi:MAG: hypothetical protein A3J54_01590 [Candidatus Ryanbacteria bacterium RIFCSPHIGHO2_02_FULL_45_13b]|uniref:Uncharacterized protein n=1 Tax=Candidatus Ryanbacteria bacterium RIFCSPHIGHO2_02_FULL_45_13b TaxID=1802117 RepID=A0A1G2G9U0_9BACT|nr:MAG: hypothetical protein A3J54_01590 [Candidatus Ryanbacteria bacterium RIFCSPHIGHO2_02_FULL_45_13b]